MMGLVNGDESAIGKVLYEAAKGTRTRTQDDDNDNR